MSDPSPQRRQTAADPAGPPAATRYWQRWQAGARSDVDAFLAEAGPLPPGQVAAVLHVDQRQRWQAGTPVWAEDYLRRYPAVRAEPEAALDLIYGEYLLRDELDEGPAPAEYLRRFPDHAEVLRLQMELHHAVEVGAGLESTSRPTRSGAGTDSGPAAAPPAAAAWPEVPGYEVVGELGCGGMGVVYRALDPDLQRGLAVKVLRPEHRGHPEQERRFWDEARLAAQLQHPGVPPVHEGGRLPDGRPFFAMKLVRGPHPGRAAAGAAGAGGGLAALRGRLRAGVPDAGLRPQQRGDPPRPQAGQRHGGRLRRGPGHGLGPRQAPRPRRRDPRRDGRRRAHGAHGRPRRPLPGRPCGRHAGVHAPGAGHRRGRAV